jgi:hypothetical protein
MLSGGATAPRSGGRTSAGGGAAGGGDDAAGKSKPRLSGSGALMRLRVWSIHNQRAIFYVGAALVAAAMIWRAWRKHVGHFSTGAGV